MHRHLAPAHRRQRLLGRNPPVHDPHPLGPAVLRLDLRQKLRQRRVVARHHLVGQRKPFRGHDQRDHHLHAVRALVAAVAELALARKRRVAFKIGGSQVIEQNIETGLEQRLPAFAQKREKCSLVLQHLVQATIQRVASDDPHRAVQQVPQGAVLVPVPAQTPLAARFEQLVAHLRFEHVQPARALPARRQPRSPEPIQLQSIPKRQRQPAPTPLPWPVHAELLDVDPDRLAVQFRGFASIGEKRHRRRSTIPLQHLDGPAPRRPLAVVDLTQIQHLTLNHTPVAVAAVLHHAPVPVLFAVFETSLGAHEQGAIACPNHTPNQGPRSALQPNSHRPCQSNPSVT